MTIFVDMDEVLADTYQAHIDIYNAEFGTDFTKKDVQGKDFWKCVPEQNQQSVKDHAWQKGFFKDLNVIPHSQEVMQELCAEHDVFIASAAMQFPNSLKEKSDWLDEHFPFVDWRYRILCGYKLILKGDVLIDDRPYNLKSFEGRSMLFTSPHNVNALDFERVSTWQEVAEKLL